MAEAGEGKRGRRPKRKASKPDKQGNGRKKRRKGPPGRGKKPTARPRGDMLLAISHPLRRRILRKLAEGDDSTSPTQLADELEGPLGKIAYHVRVLWRLGALAAAGEQQVRGAVEHFYVSTIKDDPPIETLLEETRKEDEEED